MRTILLLLVTACIVISCNVAPQPILYGQDGCHFCSMTIVDRLHASQLVTTKGKVYKFDAIECMVHYIEENKDIEYSHIVVADFRAPGTLLNAKNASFLISPEISSPMGAFLSAFTSKEVAQTVQTEFSGTIYSWDELCIQLKR